MKFFVIVYIEAKSFHLKFQVAGTPSLADMVKKTNFGIFEAFSEYFQLEIRYPNCIPWAEILHKVAPGPWDPWELECKIWGIQPKAFGHSMAKYPQMSKNDKIWACNF